MRTPWKYLDNLKTNTKIPPLLIKHDVGAASYIVWLTDLTFIWSESLDSRSIKKRSLNIDTSIDPTEGSDQLRLFLKRVTDALEQRQGSTLSVARDDAVQNLVLKTCTILPGSLRPLEWFLELTPSPQSTLTSEFMLPLLGQRITANLEKASLLQLLKEKDQIISKLIDKLEANGDDLGSLFPSVAASMSGKSNSRQALGKSVRGFNEFDRETWQANLRQDSTTSDDVTRIVSSAFENEIANDFKIHYTFQYNEWWKSLRRKDSQLTEPSQSHLRSQEDEAKSQEDFQVCQLRNIRYK